ncbi:GNAT family N-acetyltransferase [Rhodococcus sp. NPDC057529]|uniref:GNAT family N-acetyltransferase n=1 Tax=Rhodococcus sp. NPDC057529 TaxID=3346158 RepID=UPI00366B64F9
MSAHRNQYNQPIGEPVPDWTARRTPAATTLDGTYCRLEPLDPEQHADDLYAAYRVAPDHRDWTYMAADPFTDAVEYRRYVREVAQYPDRQDYAVIDREAGKAVGTLSLMRQDPNNGVIEVGNVMFSPLLKRTAISTEAQFRIMAYVFDDLGYRRYEWKCDSLNAPRVRRPND